MVPGSEPLNEVLVALCVPESCDPPALRSALQASLQNSSFQVQVQEEHCVSHEERAQPLVEGAGYVFWYVLTFD